MEPSLVEQLSLAASVAMRDAWASWQDGTLPDEDGITAVFAQRFGKAGDGFVTPSGYQLAARALTHRRSGEEKQVGADFGVKLQVDTDELKACYGWIAQAKMPGRIPWVGTTYNPGLREQCAAMLKVTPASYAIVYGSLAKVYSANDIAGLVTWRGSSRLTPRSVSHHFGDFFAGAFGDRIVCSRIFDSAVVRGRRRRFGPDAGRELVPVGTQLDMLLARPDSEVWRHWQIDADNQSDREFGASEDMG